MWAAHQTNTLGPPCNPKGWILHTPEEPADGDPGTPRWFAQYHANPLQRGSTHYFVSYLGFVFQCVPESVAPIANGVLGKPYPAWADPNVSLNRQTLSVEIEGYAATITQTIWSPQKTALDRLLDYGCAKYSIPVDRAHIIGHYEVASNRSDPGTLDIDALVAELQEEDDMGLTQEDKQWFERLLADFAKAQIHDVRRRAGALEGYEANVSLNDLLRVIEALSNPATDTAAVINEIRMRLSS